MRERRRNSPWEVCCALAPIGLALPFSLFAISSALSLRSLHTSTETAAGYLTQGVAIALVVILPSLLIVWPVRLRYCAAICTAGAIVALVLSLPRLAAHHSANLLLNPAALAFFAVTLVLILAAAGLARVTQSALTVGRWAVLAVTGAGYFGLIAGVFVLTFVALFVE